MQTLKDIKIIDDKRSVLDKEETKKQGKKVFKVKHYIVPGDRENIPEHQTKWVNQDPKMISQMKYAYGYTFVTEDDPYTPEGAVDVDENGHYKFMDTVLMFTPMNNHLERRMGEVKRSERSTKAPREQFEQMAREKGAQPTNPEDYY
jgi:hypothetical protein